MEGRGGGPAARAVESPFAGELNRLLPQAWLGETEELPWPRGGAGTPTDRTKTEVLDGALDSPFALDVPSSREESAVAAEGWDVPEHDEQAGPDGVVSAARLEWPGQPEERLAFMRAVYDAQAARSRSAGGTFTADLPEGDLAMIEGGHRARRDAAQAAIALLRQARADLRTAGHGDRVRIGIVSAYRPASEQFRIWQGKGRKGGFPHYYQQLLDRHVLSPGDHSPEAVAKMARYLAGWIAAPGYSNHQDGLAIDFGTGSSGTGLGLVGTHAWFHAWLVEHAHHFGFRPYEREAWHWTYGGTPGAAPVSVSEPGHKAPSVAAGVTEFVVPSVPLLSAHRGTGPDLILRWNVSSAPEEMDVVVHLHGYWAPGLSLPRDVLPVSGLDLAPIPGTTGNGRSRPTLAVLPRGHDTGVRQKVRKKDGSLGDGPYDAFTFPQLETSEGLTDLIRFALDRFAGQTRGATPRLGRLILTAHSGGGAALLHLLRHHDPQQIHVFDALYQDAGPLLAWARRHIRADRIALQGTGAAAGRDYMTARGGALRVFYQDRLKGGTRPHSRALAAEIAAELGPGLDAWYRVEASRYDHFQIPRRYGWRLLADASADLPDAYSEPVTHREAEVAGNQIYEGDLFESRDLEAPEVADLRRPEPSAEAQTEEEDGAFEEGAFEDGAFEDGAFEDGAFAGGAFEDGAFEDGESADVETGEAEAYAASLPQPALASEEETAPTVTFPSGATLRVLSGPTGVGEEHFDPTASGNPLLDTSPPVRATLLSAHFTVGELARSGGTSFDKARIDPRLVRCLQKLRDGVGKPITVTSGYRAFAYNQKLYRETYQRPPTKSRHSSGQAADVRIAGMTGMQIAKAALDACGTDLGVGIASTYAHLDVRGTWARWTYFGAGTERDRRAIAEIDAHRQVAGGRGVPADGAPAQPETPTAAQFSRTVPVGRRYKALVPLLDRYRGDIPIAFLLGWIDVESNGRIDVVTHLDERGFFQIHPAESHDHGIEHGRLSTDPDHSVRAGVQIVRAYADLARRRFPWLPPGSELFWRIVKLQHAMGSPLARALLADMQSHGVPVSWESVKAYERSDAAQGLHKLLRVRPGRFGENVDAVFERGGRLARSLGR